MLLNMTFKGNWYKEFMKINVFKICILYKIKICKVCLQFVYGKYTYLMQKGNSVKWQFQNLHF